MSTTLYTDIRAALASRLASMPDVPEIAEENKPYIPKVETPYLEPSVMWAEGNQAELGENGRNWERGIYQIKCHYPENQGIGPANAMMGQIREWFKRGTVCSYNGLNVTVRKVYLSPNNIVNIAFYCQAEN